MDFSSAFMRATILDRHVNDLLALIQQYPAQAIVAPNPIETQGGTLLHWRWTYKSQQVVQALLAYGADPNAKDTNGDTALDCMLSTYWLGHNTPLRNACGRLLIDYGGKCVMRQHRMIAELAEYSRNRLRAIECQRLACTALVAALRSRHRVPKDIVLLICNNWTRERLAWKAWEIPT